MRRLVDLCVVLFGLVPIVSTVEASDRPRLLVLVTVDQFPREYLQRFRTGLANDGFFTRAAREGFSFDNCHHGHAFTFTGPGHAVLLTGAYPRNSAIIGNSWFDRETERTMNCVGDDKAHIVGAPDGAGMSARNLQAPTVGDQMKLVFGEQAKVFGIGWKDRSPVLTAGRLADAAYWFDDDSGNWVTSDAYQNELPGWLRVLNEGGAARAYGGQSWTRLYDRSQYQTVGDDDNPFEKPGSGLTRAFPHDLPAASDANYWKRLGISPFANDYILRTARELIEQEKLGADDVPDLISVCLSANDYIGHAFGPHSLEAEDMTYRTDRQLGEFATFLDETVGAGRWTLALSSDHGVGPIPELAAAQGLDAIRTPLGSAKDLQARLETHLRSALGVSADEKPSLVMAVDTTEVFLRRDHAQLSGEAFLQAQRSVRDWLLAQPSVADAVTREELLAGGGNGSPLRVMFHRAFHKQRSGDVLYALKPFYLDTASLCASHGTPWSYDTHVPLFFVGAGIQHGRSSRTVHPGSIAPTFSSILRIEVPAACEHERLDDALRIE